MRASLRRVGEVVRKELHQLFRDPRLWRVLFVAPIVQLVVFGYAVSTDVRDTATFLVDLDATPASRSLASSLTASGHFTIAGRSRDPADLVRALDHGEAVLGVVVPVGFARDLAAAGAEVQLLVDGSTSNVATIALGQAEQILARHGAAAAGGACRPAIELRDRAWYNPDLDSRNYNVPAVIGMLVLLVCLLLTALAVVREREVGTLEQLMVTPIRPWEILLGKTLPFALIGLVDLALVSLVALLWFRVPFVGNPLVLLLATVLFLLPALGMGLVVSTVSRTQQEAFMASFLLFMPAILLSGFMFPVASMPPLFRWLTLVNPLRHYLEIVRGVFLKGVGLAELWPQHLALLALGLAALGVVAARFEKRVG